MNVIEDTIYKLRQFEQTIDESIRETVQKYDYIVIDMNVQDQLYERGIDRNGVELLEYAQATIEFKQLNNQPYDRTTLRDTGDFHRSWTIKFGFDSFELVPEDIKTEALIAKYGEEVIGLTDENFNEFCWEYIYPALLKKLRGNTL